MIYFKRFLLAAAVLFLGACGLDDYPFIEPVHQSSVQTFFNNRATIDLRYYDGSNPDFSHFAIFYRIYISDVVIGSTTTGTFSTINPTLQQNFNRISPYIDSDTLVNANMHEIFRSMSFWYLTLENNVDINGILRGAIGSIVEFEFPANRNPVLRAGGGEYVLWRSNDSNRFSPRPDRLFRNTEQLRDSANLISTINADVADKANASREHTYAAMFIAAVGFNPMTLSEFYSTPALIHVFMLPD